MSLSVSVATPVVQAPGSAPNASEVRGLAVHTSRAPADDSPKAVKLRHATQEFEGFLVSAWWQEMQSCLRDPDDPDTDDSFDSLQGLGFQAMATSMAAAGGGLGIARLLYHQLAPALTHDHGSAEPSPRTE